MKYAVKYQIAEGGYSATYDRIIYVYNGKTRTKNVSGANTYTIQLTEILGIDETAKALEELETEIATSKIVGMFSNAYTMGVVNSLHSKVANENWIIDEIQYKNQNETDGVWDIEKDPPSEYTSISRGRTIIDSEAFEVVL